MHEVSGHAYDIIYGISPIKNYTGGNWTQRNKSEQNAVALENEYRVFLEIDQRPHYGYWEMPIYIPDLKMWVINPQEMGNSPDVETERIIGPAEPWSHQE